MAAKSALCCVFQMGLPAPSAPTAPLAADPPPPSAAPASPVPDPVPDPAPLAADPPPPSAVPAPPVDVPWPAPRPRVYVGLGGGVDVPATSTPTPDLRAEVGVDFGGRFRTGLVLASRAPSVLYLPDDARWMTGLSALATASFDVGRRSPVWLTVGLGAHAFDLHGTRSRGSLSVPGVTVTVPGTTFSARGSGVAGSFGVSVPRRLSDWAALEPYLLIEGGSYDPDDVRGNALVLVPMSLRAGFKVTILRHVGAGLPPAKRR